MAAFDADSFDYVGSAGWYASTRALGFTPVLRNADAFYEGGAPPPPPVVVPYFRMQGRDLGASLWRQWTAPNAPDLAAAYYSGPPVASWGDIFVIATWSA